MKKAIACAIVLMMLSGCADHTRYGECVGVFTNQNPAYDYKLSKWNALFGIVFFETVIVPVFWLADYAMCPYRPAAHYHPQAHTTVGTGDTGP